MCTKNFDLIKACVLMRTLQLVILAFDICIIYMNDVALNLIGGAILIVATSYCYISFAQNLDKERVRWPPINHGPSSILGASGTRHTQRIVLLRDRK